VGVLLGAVSESVVGAEVIRAYGIADRPGPPRRGHREPPGGADSALRTSVTSFSAGELASGSATAAVVVVGVLLGVGGSCRSAS
jgi:hypothetical protein